MVILQDMLRTLFTGLVLSVMTILLAPVAVLAHVLRYDVKRSSVQQWCMRTWARSLCWAAGAKLVLHGAEHISPDRGTVYASNHVSWFDTFAMAALLPRYTFVAKAELRRIPIFGWGAEGAGVVFLSRENRKSAFEAYAKVAERVAEGLSVVVFPEGTRGDSYALRPFKKGPFVLAIAAGAPVIPVVVYGAREVSPREGVRVSSGTIHVHLLEPIPTTGYDYDHRHDLMKVVWRRMADLLESEYGIATQERAVA
ncbi:MAG: acyltransferase [Gemmatimonadetes bacterium]|nr:acyltransferase [Gemmatimonadota bacterium]